MTMSGRVTPISYKSGNESAQSQKWSACCWTSCILQPIQFGQLGEYSGSTTKILLEYYQYYYYKPKTWAASTSLAHDLLAFASSGSTHLHISLSQSSHVLSFQSFVLWSNVNFHISCRLPSYCIFSFTFSSFATITPVLTLLQLLISSPQSWEPKRKKLQGVSKKSCFKAYFLVVSYKDKAWSSAPE